MARWSNDGTVQAGAGFEMMIPQGKLTAAEQSRLEAALTEFIGGAGTVVPNPDFIAGWYADIYLGCELDELHTWAERLAAFLREFGVPRGTCLVAFFGKGWGIPLFPDNKGD